MPIVNYLLRIKPLTNEFRIDVQFQDGQQQPLQIGSMDEFTAVAAVLSRGNAAMLPDGTIQARG